MMNTMMTGGDTPPKKKNPRTTSSDRMSPTPSRSWLLRCQPLYKYIGLRRVPQPHAASQTIGDGIIGQYLHSAEVYGLRAVAHYMSLHIRVAYLKRIVMRSLDDPSVPTTDYDQHAMGLFQEQDIMVTTPEVLPCTFTRDPFANEEEAESDGPDDEGPSEPGINLDNLQFDFDDDKMETTDDVDGDKCDKTANGGHCDKTANGGHGHDPTTTYRTIVPVAIHTIVSNAHRPWLKVHDKWKYECTVVWERETVPQRFNHIVQDWMHFFARGYINPCTLSMVTTFIKNPLVWQRNKVNGPHKLGTWVQMDEQVYGKQRSSIHALLLRRPGVEDVDMCRSNAPLVIPLRYDEDAASSPHVNDHGATRLCIMRWCTCGTPLTPIHLTLPPPRSSSSSPSQPSSSLLDMVTQTCIREQMEGCQGCRRIAQCASLGKPQPQRRIASPHSIASHRIA